MPRFDVYEFNSGDVQYVIDVQADLLSNLKSRVVLPLVPLSKVKNEVVPRLKPVLNVLNQDYVLMTTDIGVVSIKSLGEPLTNLENSSRDEITNAIDFLFLGF